MKRYTLAAMAVLLVGFTAGAASSFAPCIMAAKSTTITAVNSPRKYVVVYNVTCGGGDFNSCNWEGVEHLTKGGIKVTDLTTQFIGYSCGLVNANHVTKDYPVPTSGQYDLTINIVDPASGLVVDTHNLTHTFP